MDRKIIFLDIDGTLTVPGSNVPPQSALNVIKQAQENGHLVYLCTGRNYDMLSPLLSYGFDGVVASSGAYILCKDQVIYDCPMKESEQQIAMDTLRENGIFRTVECLDGSYTDEGFKIFLEQNAQKGGNSELLRWRKQIESSLNIKPMAEYQGQPIYKIVFMSPQKESVDLIQQKLGEQFQLCIHDTDQYGIINGELLKKDYDKGKGIQKICAYYDIPVSDTIAFGDSMNDLEMFEVAGLSICMENGSPKLKALADDICPAVEEDGLAKAFGKYIL